MMYLAFQIIIYLMISFILGVICGWSVKNLQAKQIFKRIEKMYQINLASLKSNKDPS